MNELTLQQLRHLLCLLLQCCKHTAADGMLAVWHTAALQAYCSHAMP
jgi:hypothetical protein